MPVITVDTAKEFAAKSVEARRQYSAERANLRQELADLQAALAAERALRPVIQTIELTGELARVSKRLDQLNAAMDTNGLAPQQWDMLTRAYDRVFKAWMVLTATPGPGQRKPSSTRQPRQPAGPGYTIPEVVPDPPQSSPAQAEQDKPAL